MEFPAFEQRVARFSAMSAEMGKLATCFVASSSVVVGKAGFGRWVATCGAPKGLVTTSVVVAFVGTTVVADCSWFHHVQYFFMDFLPWERVLPSLQTAETGVVVAPQRSSILCL